MHTHGKWTVCATWLDGAIVRWHIAGDKHGSSYPICEHVIEQCPDAQEQLDNAKLIASAPDMYLEIRRLSGQLESVISTLDAANDELHATQDMNKSLLAQLDDARMRLAVHRGEHNSGWVDEAQA